MAVPIGADTDLTAEARIRRAALELFAERGYDATTTRAIALAAGVSPGLVLHHFGSKKGLRDRVDEDVVVTVDRLFADIVPDGTHDEIAFERWVSNFRRLFSEHQHVTGYLRRSLLEGSPATAHLFDAVLAFSDTLHRRFVEAGVAPAPSDPQATVAVQVGMWLTAVLLADHVDRYLGESEEPAETRLAKATLELVRHGTLIPPAQTRR